MGLRELGSLTKFLAIGTGLAAIAPFAGVQLAARGVYRGIRYAPQAVRDFQKNAKEGMDHYGDSYDNMSLLGDKIADAAEAKWSTVKAFGRGAGAIGQSVMENSKLGPIVHDIRGLKDVNLDQLAAKMSPEAMQRWRDTRIFGKSSPRMQDGKVDSYKFEANSGLVNDLWGLGLAPTVAAAGIYGAASIADNAAGLLVGGPGYGGAIGFGEGSHGKDVRPRNGQNRNYQGQMMGLQALSSNQVAPQYSLTIAPMRQRRATASLRESTQGLTLGLHKGRHGGY